MDELTRTYVEREADRRLHRFDLRAGDEIRRLRVEAGVSYAELGRIVGADPSHLSRLERGLARPSIELLMRLGIALGADLSLRYFPGDGSRLHDRFQAPMVEELLRSLDRRWSTRLEVPIIDPARGVIDVVLDDRPAPVTVATESCSDIARLEQLIRWSNEKADGLDNILRRDRLPNESARRVSRLLLIRSTTQNRQVANRFRVTLSTAYPARTRDVVLALTTRDAPWPGSGIAWMRVSRGEATLLGFPPRGVVVGR